MRPDAGVAVHDVDLADELLGGADGVGRPDGLPTGGRASLSSTDGRSRPWGDRLRWAAAVASAALLLGLVVAATVFHAEGGRWFVVRTPSMGRTAPVGTLVLTRPVRWGDLRVGDVIAFHPPTEPAQTYTHRIVAIDAQGITTRGDINGARDPWSVRADDVIGRRVWIAPGLGYLFRALPILLIGGVVVWGATAMWLRPDRRGPARMLGGSVIYLVVALLLRPFVGVIQLAATTDQGRTTISAVSTGIVPVRIVPTAGRAAAPLDLGYGDTGTIVLTRPPAGGGFDLNAHIHLGWTGWLLVAAVCVQPLLWVLVVGFRRTEPDPYYQIPVEGT